MKLDVALQSMSVSLTLFWIFGVICGGIVVYTKLRYAAAVADRLSGKTPEKKEPFLTQDNKYAFIICLSIVVAIGILAFCVYGYHLRQIERSEKESQLMLNSGYVPTRLAGWARKEDLEKENPLSVQSASAAVNAQEAVGIAKDIVLEEARK